MQMTLKSMTDFVLQFEQNEAKSPELRKFLKGVDSIVNYAKFLKQSLTLGMFVPCDEDGNVLEEPKEDIPTLNKDFGYDMQYDVIKMEEYKEAEEKVLFVFDFNNPHHLMESYNTIEDLANFYSPLLTESAIKQFLK